MTIEKPVLDGLGIVDVVLEKRGWAPIACEISVTTYVPRGVRREPTRFASAAATVRRWSASPLGRLSIRPPSFVESVSSSSPWRTPAASLTISPIGQYVMPSP